MCFAVSLQWHIRIYGQKFITQEISWSPGSIVIAWVQERDRLPESDQGTCKHLNFIYFLCMLYIQGTLVDKPLAEGTPSQQCAMETAIQLNATGHPEFQTPPLWWHLSRYNWIFVCITIEYIPLLRMTAQYLDLTLPLQCKTQHNLCSKCKFATRTNWFQVDIALELCVPWFVENSIQQTSIEQGRRKLPKGGTAVLLDQSNDAAKGSDIEARKDDNSAQSAEKFFRLPFQLSGWAFVALSYFWRPGSVAFKLFAAINL